MVFFASILTKLYVPPISWEMYCCWWQSKTKEKSKILLSGYLYCELLLRYFSQRHGTSWIFRIDEIHHLFYCYIFPYFEMVFLRCDMESDIFGWIDLVSYYQGRRIKAGFRDKKCQTKTQNFVFIKTLIVWKEKLKSFYGVSWECFALELFKNKA